MSASYDLSDYNHTVDQIAEKLGYTAQRVRTLAQTGKLPAIKRFRQWLFCEAEVLQTLKTLSPVAGSPASSTVTAEDPKRKKDNDITNSTSTDANTEADNDILR